MDDAEPEQTQQQRATEAIAAVAAGADPVREAYLLANEFTDRQAGRLAAWLKRPTS
ncbi:MAG: hypothetical protein ABJB03_01795 [Rhodoglobus sp.]